MPSAGRNWISLKTNISLAGTIRSVEITHGMNGWHPHLHALVYVRGDPGAEGLAALAVDVRSRWERFIAGVAPTRPHPRAPLGHYWMQPSETARPGSG